MTAVQTRRRKTRAGDGEAAIVDALDTLALIMRQTKNRGLVPLYDRLERELAALDDGDEIMSRALKRNRRKGPRS